MICFSKEVSPYIIQEADENGFSVGTGQDRPKRGPRLQATRGEVSNGLRGSNQIGAASHTFFRTFFIRATLRVSGT